MTNALVYKDLRSFEQQKLGSFGKKIIHHEDGKGHERFKMAVNRIFCELHCFLPRFAPFCRPLNPILIFNCAYYTTSYVKSKHFQSIFCRFCTLNTDRHGQTRTDTDFHGQTLTNKKYGVQSDITDYSKGVVMPL